MQNLISQSFLYQIICTKPKVYNGGGGFPLNLKPKIVTFHLTFPSRNIPNLIPSYPALSNFISKITGTTVSSFLQTAPLHSNTPFRPFPRPHQLKSAATFPLFFLLQHCTFYFSIFQFRFFCCT